jgi:hypothetical protein
MHLSLEFKHCLNGSVNKEIFPKIYLMVSRYIIFIVSADLHSKLVQNTEELQANGFSAPLHIHT